MRIWVKVLLAAAVVAVCATSGDAFGRRRSGCGGGSGGYGDCGAPCGMTVSFVEQQVTAYRAELRTRPVEVTVYRTVAKPVTFEYTVNEQVITPTTQKVTTYQVVNKPVTFEYTAYETVVTPTPQKVTTYQVVTRPVTFEYTVNEQVITPTTQQVTTYQVVTKPVTFEYTAYEQVITPTTQQVTTYLRPGHDHHERDRLPHGPLPDRGSLHGLRAHGVHPAEPGRAGHPYGDADGPHGPGSDG